MGTERRRLPSMEGRGGGGSGNEILSKQHHPPDRKTRSLGYAEIHDPFPSRETSLATIDSRHKERRLPKPFHACPTYGMRGIMMDWISPLVTTVLLSLKPRTLAVVSDGKREERIPRPPGQGTREATTSATRTARRHGSRGGDPIHRDLRNDVSIVIL